MKFKKIIKFTLIALLAVSILGVSGLFVWSKTGTYPAGPIALDALASTGSVAVSQDKFITFTPAVETDTGLIFYPGGLVEPAAYAPVLRNIAEQGVLVIIAPMPFNLAIFNPNTAERAIETYPHISTWILAGHSLGGASAAIYAGNKPATIDALAFWDSYPPDSSDLSDIDIPVLSIYGTTNGIPNTDNFNDKRYLLPANAAFTPIEGASHAQFGDYGPQKGDIVPAISQAEQHERVTEIMLDFILSAQ